MNNGKNFYKLFFFLVVFLFITKLPSILTTDIQPWDEGMYALRVLSIHDNGDFIDQSAHSVGKFYSGSHPPLLIWIGYFVTLAFGFNAIVFKLIAFTFSIFCVLLIFLTGKKFFNQTAGFYAALIFSANIIFNIFSKRFQFDFPYTFFILLSFYSLFLFNDYGKIKYLLISGISFGCCLMVKILVGLFIPAVLFISFLLIKEEVNYKFKDLFLLTAVGIGVALPWHLYMIFNYGKEFTDVFFGFHLYQRALAGVEMNEKSSGIFFYFKFLLTIFPFSVILFFALIEDLRNYKNLNWEKIFLWVWFFTGLIVITFFRTKLEVYVLLVIPPLSLLIPSYISKLDAGDMKLKMLVLIFFLLNFIWYVFSFSKFYSDTTLQTISILVPGIILGILFMLVLLHKRYGETANKIELKKSFYIFILVYFFLFNIFFAVRINEGESDFKITAIADYIKKSKKEKIVYVGSEYRYNPQFSFYFNGMDQNLNQSEYEFELLDTKDGIEKTKGRLTGLSKNNCYIIVEKDNINRGKYLSSDLFLPENFKLILKQEGYELYEN